MPDRAKSPRLQPYSAEAICEKCGHDDIGTRYEADSSHYGCPIGKEMRTSYGPEHISRWCQRCHFHWEEGTLPTPTTSKLPNA